LDLTINYETKYGTIDKDYKKYLGNFTVIPYEIPPHIYDELLR
jgi:hypothetical protein